ncbi:MAG: nitroreductase family protein [Terracidiphilus sp.]
MNKNRRNFLCMAAAGSALCATGTATAFSAPSSDSGLLDLFAKRQSVRRYKSDPVPEEHLRQILDAARRPPTSGNQQPWKFLVVRNKATIERLRARSLQVYESNWPKDLSPVEKASRTEQATKHLAGYFSAPLFIVVLTDSQSMYPSYNHHDGPLAAGYLCLAARALGYGTVYVTDAIPEQATREVLSIPERYERVCITPLGIPDGWPEPMPKKKFEEFVVFESFA